MHSVRWALHIRHASLDSSDWQRDLRFRQGMQAGRRCDRYGRALGVSCCITYLYFGFQLRNLIWESLRGVIVDVVDGPNDGFPAGFITLPLMLGGSGDGTDIT
jgi:hypothetical protein